MFGGKETTDMKRKSPLCRKKKLPKSVLRLPDLEHARNAVLNSLSSPDAQRGYRHAIDEVVDWYCSEPRLAFNRIVVLRYRAHLESRGLAPGSGDARQSGNKAKPQSANSLKLLPHGFRAAPRINAREQRIHF
jgi:hypothetical protein